MLQKMAKKIDQTIFKKANTYKPNSNKGGYLLWLIAIVGAAWSSWKECNGGIFFLKKKRKERKNLETLSRKFGTGPFHG